MRIAQLAPPFEAVPPAKYGGTERVVALLTDELVRRGHDVTLFASGDSRTSARLVPVVDQALWHVRPPYHDFAPFLALTLGKLMRELHDFDLVHSHLDFHGFALGRVLQSPVVTTLHGRLDLPELVPLYREYREAPLVSISDAQRRPMPAANWVATVHHGIALDEFTFRPAPGQYLAFLGRISPEKGLDAAIRIARRAGLSLKVGARLPLPYTDDPNVRRDREYYEQTIRPLLREPGIELVGEVAGREKDELLGNAAALLFPICWPEPFGLVMPEAFACGTPVLALRCGSVPEIVESGRTGFIGETEDDLVAAVALLGEIDRAECRRVAEDRFSPPAMAARYEAVYESLGAVERAVAVPKWIPPRALGPVPRHSDVPVLANGSRRSGW